MAHEQRGVTRAEFDQVKENVDKLIQMATYERGARKQLVLAGDETRGRILAMGAAIAADMKALRDAIVQHAELLNEHNGGLLTHKSSLEEVYAMGRELQSRLSDLEYQNARWLTTDLDPPIYETLPPLGLDQDMGSRDLSELLQVLEATEEDRSGTPVTFPPVPGTP